MRVERPESLPSPERTTLPPRRRRSSPLLGNRHGVFGALALELRKGLLEGEGRVRVAANPSTQVPVKAPTPAQPASNSLARPVGLELTRVTEGGPGRTNDLGSLETVGERGRPDPDAAPWSAFARPNAGSTSVEPTQSPHHRTPRSASIQPTGTRTAPPALDSHAGYVAYPLSRCITRCLPTAPSGYPATFRVTPARRCPRHPCQRCLPCRHPKH